jgi:hypothetical protein
MSVLFSNLVERMIGDILVDVGMCLLFEGKVASIAFP